MRADVWDCPEEGCDVVFTEKEGGHLAIMEHVVAVHIHGGRDTTSPGFGTMASEPAPQQDDVIEKAADVICDVYERYAPVDGVLRSEAPNIARALQGDQPTEPKEQS